MIKKIICGLVVSIFLFSSINAIGTNLTNTNEETNDIEVEDDGWYYLPAQPNYAPKGLPDFDQCSQDDWKSRGFIWSFCAPTSLADIFYWFDSKHSDPNGFPGDGFDNYSLVKNLNSTDTPNPGPLQDDHNFNNVNSNQTPSPYGQISGELIEQIAWYVNQNNRQGKLRFKFWGGTKQKDIFQGVNDWIRDAGLEDDYSVEQVQKPTFSYVCEKLKQDCGIVILFRFVKPAIFPRLFPVFCGHYVALAGVNQRDGYIAVSDPYLNVMNPEPTPQEHLNASVVSHDIYKVESLPHDQYHASWWAPGYWRFGGFVTYALIISET